jgi:hypothetical protein
MNAMVHQKRVVLNMLINLVTSPTVGVKRNCHIYGKYQVQIKGKKHILEEMTKKALNRAHLSPSFCLSNSIFTTELRCVSPSSLLNHIDYTDCSEWKATLKL